MRLDETDSHILELKGNAKDIMRDIFGEELGASNAGKQLAGISFYIGTADIYRNISTILTR